MKNRIIQWNCRGLKANYEETLLLLKEYEPAALCLQETHLKDTQIPFPSEITLPSILSLQTMREPLVVSLSLSSIMLLIVIYR